MEEKKERIRKEGNRESNEGLKERRKEGIINEGRCEKESHGRKK